MYACCTPCRRHGVQRSHWRTPRAVEPLRWGCGAGLSAVLLLAAYFFKYYYRPNFKQASNRSIYGGGKSPCRNKTALNWINPVRLSCNNSTVARPVGEMPVIWVKSSFHWKWSRQTCWRGWKRGTSIEVNRSSAVVLAAFRLLQPPQATARFSNSLLPPWIREWYVQFQKCREQKPYNIRKNSALVEPLTFAPILKTVSVLPSLRQRLDGELLK